MSITIFTYATHVGQITNVIQKQSSSVFTDTRQDSRWRDPDSLCPDFWFWRSFERYQFTAFTFQNRLGQLIIAGHLKIDETSLFVLRHTDRDPIIDVNQESLKRQELDVRISRVKVSGSSTAFILFSSPLYVWKSLQKGTTRQDVHLWFESQTVSSSHKKKEGTLNQFTDVEVEISRVVSRRSLSANMTSRKTIRTIWTHCKYQEKSFHCTFGY